MTERFTLHNGDCLEVLRGLDDCSVDAIVTDPPAGISFMSRDWDKDKGGRAEWIAWMREIAAECLRVIKPGGHALVWAIPRTSHWTGTAWEDAGWQPRDKVYHVFGSGFPKSLDVSKAIDKAAGAEREVVGQRKSPYTPTGRNTNCYGEYDTPTADDGYLEYNITAPATDAARQWQGWGTALKPAAEEWWLFRKPLTGTVAANVLEWGTGGLNVDGCRVGTSKPKANNTAFKAWRDMEGRTDRQNPNQTYDSNQGRWPANFTHDGSDEVVGLFPVTKSGGGDKHGHKASTFCASTDWESFKGTSTGGDTGSAARFFYCAKASRADRNEGCEGLDAKQVFGDNGDTYQGLSNSKNPSRNHHPTVKPTSLMRWLCRLITPPGGIVLDPFTGSGSTGKAAMLEGMRFVGIEREAEYVEIARARISHAADEPQQSDLFS